MVSNEQQEAVASHLNSVILVRIAPSKIHGVGVFAIRDLQKGQKLFLDSLPKVYESPHKIRGKLFAEVWQLVVERWPRVVSGERFAYPDARYQAYVNHADEPNYDGESDLLLCEVKKGEEILEDYRKIPGWDVAFPWLLDKK